MEKIYYNDQYVKAFTAEVISTKESNGTYHIELDKTAFFPGGGGQHCDLGKIENIDVIDVYEENGIIYHVLNKKLLKIHKVKCEIDWQRREDGMHQHFGQHLLSGSFFTVLNANTVSVHFGKDISTVDIVGNLSEEQIREVEKFANETIGRNLKVELFAPTKKELKGLKLRRDLPNTDEEIRVVKIEDLDITACCGVHPASTLDLRMIKIKRWEKNKGNTRIEFLAGKRAIDDSMKKDKFANEICRYLNSNEEEAINGIKNLNIKLKEALEEKKSLEETVTDYERKEIIENAEKVNDTSIVKKVYDNENIKYVSKLATKLVEGNKAIVIFAVKNEEKVNLVFASSKEIKEVNMGVLLKDSISLIDGKGGGSQNLAQGAGKNNNNLDGAMDYAFNKIKEGLK